MPDFSAVKNAPDISFIDYKTISDVRGEMVADFEDYMTQATGRTVTLARASERRMELYAAAAQIYQAMQFIDRGGKQNLLKYSYSEFLDNLGLWKRVVRLPAKAANTTLRFTLSADRTAAVAIPQGTRVSSGATAYSGAAIYFHTTEYAEIPAGETTVDVPAVCTTAGTEGNGLAIGELSALVDPIPYVASVSNITGTEGGAEIESDDDLAERIFLAPSAYTAAITEDGYVYKVKEYNAAIGDVRVTSDQAAGTVDIVFIMSNGDRPGTEMIDGVKGHLNVRSNRAMNDLITVAAPAEVNYSINFTYYINRSDSARAVTIQEAVQQAVGAYTAWQRMIGRDINPDELRAKVKAAGAKRLEITAPAYAVVPKTQVSALTGTPVVTYGGLEDD